MNRNCENIITHFGYCGNPHLILVFHVFFLGGKDIESNQDYPRIFYSFKLNAMLPIGTSVKVKYESREISVQFRHSGKRIICGMWFGEIPFCCCLPFLPDYAWVHHTM